MSYDKLRQKMFKDRQTYIDEQGDYWAVGNMENYTGAVKGIAIDKLAELEDKIENGTLIETEYPIYQDVYFIDYVDENYYSVGAVKGKPTVRKAFIHSVEQVMKGQILYLIQPHDLPQEVLDNEVEHTETWEWFHYSKENLFLTKAEAEAKLKELKNDL